MEMKNILRFRFDFPILGRDDDLTYQKRKDNPKSLKKNGTANVPLQLS